MFELQCIKDSMELPALVLLATVIVVFLILVLWFRFKPFSALRSAFKFGNDIVPRPVEWLGNLGFILVFVLALTEISDCYF